MCSLNIRNVSALEVLRNRSLHMDTGVNDLPIFVMWEWSSHKWWTTLWSRSHRQNLLTMAISNSILLLIMESSWKHSQNNSGTARRQPQTAWPRMTLNAWPPWLLHHHIHLPVHGWMRITTHWKTVCLSEGYSNRVFYCWSTLSICYWVLYSSTGPDLLSAGSCSEKMWGPFNWGGRPYFSWKKLATFFSHHRPCHRFSSKTGDLFLLITLISLGGRPFFRHAKNLPLLLWGPLFVGSLFGRTCWTCLNPPLLEDFNRYRNYLLAVGWSKINKHLVTLFEFVVKRWLEMRLNNARNASGYIIKQSQVAQLTVEVESSRTKLYTKWAYCKYLNIQAQLL